MKEEPIIESTASNQLAQTLAGVAIKKKGFNLVIMDMRDLIDFADYFVLCTANNARQVRAIAEDIRLVAKHEHKTPIVGVEGMDSGRWVLVDLGDIVIHVFDGPMRGFYDLDGLWRDAPRLDVDMQEDAADQRAPSFSMT